MGIAAVTLSAQWRLSLVRDALGGPVKMALAVLLASLLFHFIKNPLETGVTKLRKRMGSKLLIVAIVAFSGLISSFLTAIITSLVIVEAISRMRLDRTSETRVVVLACFSIGMGASLTPFGEPLGAVAVAKLAGEPYNADTWFLFRHLWMYVIPGILLVSAAAAFCLKVQDAPKDIVPLEKSETIVSAVWRTIKVYIFVVGLILLGAGFTPLIQGFMGSISYRALFWANISSAVLDNATLTAVEIVPSMKVNQIVAALMGFLIAGGMLVPGNIPNIIAARRLRIDNLQWAKVAVPIGMVMMIVMFVILIVQR
jgi:predicted cation transporter